MTLPIAALAALAGGLGAVARFVVDALVNRRLPNSPLPAGTLSINISGSFLLGLLTGLAARHSGLPPALTNIAGAGFCGGYTTFSTASLEVVRLWDTDGPPPGILYAVTTLTGSLLGAALGLLAATLT